MSETARAHILKVMENLAAVEEWRTNQPDPDDLNHPSRVWLKFHRSSTQADERTQHERAQRRAERKALADQELERRSGSGSSRRRSNTSRSTFKNTRLRSRVCANLNPRINPNAAEVVHQDPRTSRSPCRLLPRSGVVGRLDRRTSRSLPLSGPRSDIDDIPSRSGFIRSAGLLLPAV
jgi:hypothetical protein